MNQTLIQNGTIIDFDNLELINCDILLDDEQIITVSNKIERSIACTVIDATGLYILPGFIESHIHIESSLLTPANFAEEALRHGTTTILADPHEIANVDGTAGIDFFLENSKNLPLSIYFAVPSCVPATNLETSGAELNLADIKNLLKNPRIYGLGEMMNFPGIINGFGEARDKVSAALDAGKLVDGHAPGLQKNDLLNYISNGKNDGIVRIMNDHESTNHEEAIEKLAAGLYVAIRNGSASKDLHKILPGLLQKNISLDHCMLCCDDLSAYDLVTNGHIDRIIKEASIIFQDYGNLSKEKSIISAIKLATVNPGNYLKPFLKITDRLSIGDIKPGYRGDLLLVDNLETLSIKNIFCGGKHINPIAAGNVNSPSFNSQSKLNIRKNLMCEDFLIHTLDEQKVNIQCIGLIPDSIVTEKIIIEFTPVHDGKSYIIVPPKNSDIALLAVCERHTGSSRIGKGIVKGLRLENCAIASTVAHDSHNLIIAGSDPLLMAKAGNLLKDCGGGFAFVTQNISQTVKLPIAGLISSKTAGEVASEYNEIKNMVKSCGCNLTSPFMTLSFLALPVIPELKLTDFGLINVTAFKQTDLFI